MNRPTLIGIVIALVVVAAGMYYWEANLRVTPEERTLTEAADLLAGGATDNVLSSIDPSVSPVGEAPDTNPLTRTNPFSGVKTNPFE